MLLLLGILWVKWEFPLCLFKSFQLIAQHLEWLITTQVVVGVLLLALLYVVNMTKLFFYHWLLNLPFWHVFIRLHGIQQILKWESWHAGHMEVMLSFMLYLNMGVNLFIKAQKSSLDWWCHLLVGRYCWMRSTILSCLLTLDSKRFMLFCLLVCSGHRCENLVRKFVGSDRFVNLLRIAHRHP